MLKKIALSILFTGLIFGKSISKNEAEQIAINWFSGNGLSKQVQRTIESVETYQDGLYIVNLNPASFVIISANDESGRVFAYSDNDNFQTEYLHPALEQLLLMYSKIDEQSSNVFSENVNTTAIPDTIEALMPTKWNQTWPYNKYCPVDSSVGPGGYNYRVPVGCVATAMAQLMKIL